MANRKGSRAETHPEAPTEEWYAILSYIHHSFGHLGRDKVFGHVESITPSISKGFVGLYVSQCCTKGKASSRKQKNAQEDFAGGEPVKADRPSTGKKRVNEELDDPALLPAAKRPKAHSTEPAMVNAGDEQDPSLRNDSGFNRIPMKPARQGKNVSIHPSRTV